MNTNVIAFEVHLTSVHSITREKLTSCTCRGVFKCFCKAKNNSIGAVRFAELDFLIIRQLKKKLFDCVFKMNVSK